MAVEGMINNEPLPAYEANSVISDLNRTTTHEKKDNSSHKDAQRLISTTYPMSPTSPTSATSPDKDTNFRPRSRRKNSSSSNTTTRRPQYSRKYSTPPSRPLSPVGYPRLVDVPELDLDSPSASNFSSYFQKQNLKRHNWHRDQDQDQHLTVDTAPQEPDIFEDPETDYFTSSEMPNIPRAKGASSIRLRGPQGSTSTHTRQQSQAGVQTELDVDSEWFLPPTPGSFIVDDELSTVHRRQASTATKISFAAAQRLRR